MKTFYFLIFSLLCTFSTGSAAEIKSPDGRIVLNFSFDNIGDQKDCPVYSLSFRGKPVLAASRLGFGLESGKTLDDDLELLSSLTSSHDTTWHPVYGERSTVRDHYNQLVMQLRQKREPHYRVDIKFRCYNAGAAFCYTIHKTDALRKLDIAEEKTEFRFLGDHAAWSTTSAQGVYRKTTLSKLAAGAERPLTIKIDDTTFVALAEARQIGRASCRERV